MRASDARVLVKIAHSDHDGGVRYLFGLIDLNTNVNPRRLLVTCECGEGLWKVALSLAIVPSLVLTSRPRLSSRSPLCRRGRYQRIGFPRCWAVRQAERRITSMQKAALASSSLENQIRWVV
jgi:hypothetical protein